MTTATARWQGGTQFARGVRRAASPRVAGYADHLAPTAHASFLGLALARGSHFQASRDDVSGAWLHLAAGIWLVVAPFLLGFDALTVATATSISVGGVVAVLGGSAVSRGEREPQKGIRQARCGSRRSHVDGNRAGAGGAAQRAAGDGPRR